MRATHITCIILLIITGGDGRNLTFLLGTSTGVTMFNTGDGKYTEVGYSNTEIWAVDYHLERNLIFYISDNTIYRSTLVRNTEPISNETTALAKIDHPDWYCFGFAVDWVNNVIFYIDCTDEGLKVMDLEGNHVTTIIAEVSNAHLVEGMEVDPQEGKVFWINGRYLQCCDLTGDNYIHSLSLHYFVTSFTLDIQAGRLFYVARSKQQHHLYEILYRPDNLTVPRLLHTSDQWSNVYNLVTLDNIIYWVMNNTDVFCSHTMNLTGDPERITTVNSDVLDITIVHPMLQSPIAEDPCRLANCSYLCVTQRGIARCLYPDSIGGDGRNLTFLLGTSTGVTMVNTGDGNNTEVLHSSTDIWAVDYHLERNLVFYVSERTLYSSTFVRNTDPISFETTALAKMGRHWECYGFAVDWVHNVIFYIDCTYKSLRVMDLQGIHVTTIIAEVLVKYYVGRMEVDPHVGKVFWLADYDLQCCDLTGDNYIQSMSLNESVTSFTLDIQAGRLFFVDDGYKPTHLYEINYKTGSLQEPRILHTSGLWSDIRALVVLHNVIYWLNSTGVFRSITMNLTAEPERISTVKSVVWDIKIADPKLQSPIAEDPCRLANCHYLCVTQRGMARCLCPDGMVYGNNNTCFGRNTTDVTILVWTNHELVMFNSSTSDSVTTIVSNIQSYPEAVDYHLESNFVYFYSEPNLYKSNLTPNNASSITLVKEVGKCPAFTVDWVHDVIYWMNCSTSSLKLMDLGGNNLTTVMDRPGGDEFNYRMEVDPHVGRVLWLTRWIVEWCDLAGDNFQTNLSDPGLYVYTFTLDIPTRRLFYFVDDTLYVMSYNSDGTVGTTKQTKNMGWVGTIGVVGDYLYYSNGNSIQRRLTTVVDQPEPIKGFEGVLGFTIIDHERHKSFSGDPCRHTYCSHFCVHQRGKARCLCPDGMFLGAKMICSAKVTGLLFYTTLLKLSLQVVLQIGLFFAAFKFMLHINGRHANLHWPDWIPWRP